MGRQYYYRGEQELDASHQTPTDGRVQDDRPRRDIIHFRNKYNKKSQETDDTPEPTSIH